VIIVDEALKRREAEGHPIKVGLVGAGFMGRGIALQLTTVFPGMKLAAVVARDLELGKRACIEAGATPRLVNGRAGLAQAKSAGEIAVTDDWRLVCEWDEIDAIIEVTGSLDYAAAVVSCAIHNGKHAILMNAELDGTVGPLLKKMADRQGVIYTNSDGDQPGVTMNLYRFVRGIGVTPVVCGSIKGLHDPYRTPETQLSFAKRWGQKPHMVTSFADGTKISFEQALVANATGMGVARRGMCGPTVETGTPIETAAALLPAADYIGTPGIVDYVVGASPGPAVFVLGTIEDPRQRHYLALYKLGEGPLYCFSTPYHLCHFEVPNSVARAVLFKDVVIAPLDGPVVEVVTTAKRNLRRGEVIDDMGHYMTYGQAENADITYRERLLPMGLAAQCRLLRDVPKDQVLTYDDVEIPSGRLIDRLRAEQEELFFGKAINPTREKTARVA
jgi:predicted homoserine dehydrogenase-like protein